MAVAFVCVCVCVLGGGWVHPHLLPEPSVRRIPSSPHTHAKLARNRSRPRGFVFAESFPHWRARFSGLQKGPSARILFGNPGRPESRSAGILGPYTNAKHEKRRFWKHEKCKNIFAPALWCRCEKQGFSPKVRGLRNQWQSRFFARSPKVYERVFCVFRTSFSGISRPDTKAGNEH